MTAQFLDKEYRARINRVLDYIEYNLAEPFHLEGLASVAGFSRFHFHRIFQGMTGETPFQFIQRVRLEKAASLLLSNPDESITSIAITCGFADLSVFSRNFKTLFNQSAGQFRKDKLNKSNQSKMNRNSEQPDLKTSVYFCFETKTLKWMTNMKLNQHVEVRDFPQTPVAYIRHTGPYMGNDKLFENLWNRLFTWAGPRGLLQQPDLKSIIIYHDDPNITAEDKLRLSVCISVPPDTKADGEVGKTAIEAGKYVVARFNLTASEFKDAWEWVYGHWFPASGYQPDDGPCFEMYPEDPKDGRFTVDICVPVKPL